MKNYLDIFDSIDKNFINVSDCIYRIKSIFHLDSLVSDIIENNDWIHFICNNSYTHSNSFDKLSLFKGINIKIRLHVYNNSKDILTSIHDHRWDFASLIIKGSYTSNIYEIDESGFQTYMYKYNSSASKNNNYKLKYLSKVFLIQTNQEIFFKGDVNFGKAGQIHSINLVNNNLTITLFITTHYENKFARVFINNPNKSLENIDSEKIQKEELLLKLKYLLYYDRDKS